MKPNEEGGFTKQKLPSDYGTNVPGSRLKREPSDPTGAGRRTIFVAGPTGLRAERPVQSWRPAARGTNPWRASGRRRREVPRGNQRPMKRSSWCFQCAPRSAGQHLAVVGAADGKRTGAAGDACQPRISGDSDLKERVPMGGPERKGELIKADQPGREIDFAKPQKSGDLFPVEASRVG